MAKIILGIVGIVACFMLAEALTCNKCSFGILGFCLIGTSETCSTNTSVCYTGKATFDNIPSFALNTQGCRSDSSDCNSTKSSDLLGLPGSSYTVKIDCCTTDNCNPVVSGAPATKVTFGAAVAVAALASVWGSML